MSQAEAVALIYALARKSLAEPGTCIHALRRIVRIVEENFMEPASSGRGTCQDGGDEGKMTCDRSR